jgi:hypothetical protein
VVIQVVVFGVRFFKWIVAVAVATVLGSALWLAARNVRKSRSRLP